MTETGQRNGFARQTRIEILLRADEPIAHAEGTVGNAQVAMRQKIQMPNGRFVKVPIITGDTMRHGLREAAAYALLEAAELLGTIELSERALRFLFSGGMVLGAASDVVRLEEERRLREILPHLPLLGGCVGNRIIPGKLEVGRALLVCDETLPDLRGWVTDWLVEQGRETQCAREHVETVQRVRMDPTLDPRKHRLLAAGDAAAVQQRLLASELASVRDDAKQKLETKSTMMPFTYETIAQGSLFFWRLDAVTHTQLEHDTLYVMLAAFLSSARVGGKKGTGHGLLTPIAARGLEREVAVSRPALGELALHGEYRAPEVARFREHVRSRRDDIVQTLAEIIA